MGDESLRLWRAAYPSADRPHTLAPFSRATRYPSAVIAFDSAAAVVKLLLNLMIGTNQPPL